MLKTLHFIKTLLISLVVFFLISRAQTDTLYQKYRVLDISELLNIKIKSAGKKPEMIRDIPASVVIVTQNEIKKYGYRDLQEVLESVSGIYTIDHYSSSDVTLGVRGFWAPFTRGVVILLNGVDMKQDKYSHYPLNKIMIPVESIKRIEVVRGPMSVIYGSGALLGAINIITNDPEINSDESLVSLSFGTNSYLKGTVVLSKTIEKLKLAINASIFSSDGLIVEFSEFSNEDYYKNKSSDGFFNNSNYFFNVSGSYKNIYSEITAVRSDKPWYFKFLNKYAPNKKLSDYITYRLGYKQQLSEKFLLHAKFGYYMTNVQSELVWPFHPLYPDIEINPETFPNLMYSAWSLNSSSYDAEINAIYSLSESFDITVGLFYRRLMQAVEKDELPSLNFYGSYIQQPFDSQLQSYAAFIQSDINLFNKLKVVAGVRLEKNGKGENIWPFFYTDLETPNKFSVSKIPLEGTDIQFIPRLAMIYSFSKKNIIKFLYGEAVRMPSYIENNDVVLYPGTKPIEPERVRTAEINYYYSFNPKTALNISLYRNDLDNLIYRREWMEDGMYKATTTNEGKLITNGLELNLGIKNLYKFDLDLSLTYQKTEDKNNPDRKVMASPEILFYSKINYTISENLNIALSANYVDKMSAQWDVSKINPNGSFGGRIGDDTKSYLNLGLNLRKENLFNTKGLWMNLKVSNLLDQEIRYPAYSLSIWAEKGTLGFERRILFTFGYNFN